MKYLTHLTLFFILFAGNIFSQKNISNYTHGMKEFNLENYSSAINYFEKCFEENNIEEELLSSALIYIAESLIGLEQIDGSISKFEEFRIKYPTSNFRELALYRLGNLYFEKKLFEKSRVNLVELVKAYPASEYAGSSYHLIGESFIEDNDLDRAEDFFSSAVKSNEQNSFVDNSIYSLANLYEKKGEYSEAVRFYDKLLGYHKNSDLAAQAQMRIGICYYHLKEFDNAVLELSDPLIQDLEIDQQNEADFILANTFYSLKEYDNAKEAYSRILKNSPTSLMLDRIRYGLAWIHFQQGNYADSFKLFKLLSDSNDDSLAVKSLYWSAEAKRYEGAFGEAIEIHKNFVDKYPDHPFSEKVKLNIGISKFSQKSFTESEETLLESIDSNNPLTKTKALTMLGELNLRKKDYKTSSEYFKRGLSVPQIPMELKDRCNLGLGVAKFFMKDNIGALKNFNFINSGETSVNKNKLNFYKGEANFYIGKYNEALISYNKVSSDDDLLAKNTSYGKAYSYFNKKDFIKAAHYFNDFISNYNDDELTNECVLRLADCYYGTKSFSKASTYYERALTSSNQFNNDERSFFNYAQSLYKLGSSSKAIEVLNDIQNKFPASKYADDSQYLIGWISFQNGKFDQAITEYEKLFSKYPTSILLPIAYYSIGDSYFNMGNYPKAVESYNRVVTQYPKSSYVYDAVNGIQYCYIIEENQEEAINYLNSFISDNSELEFIDKIQFKKGEIYYSSGDYQNAISEYETLVDDYPQSELVQSSYYWMGKSAVNLDKHGEAINYLTEVIENSLNSEVAFNSILELGRIYRLQKNYDLEIDLYETVLPEISDSKRSSEIRYVKAQSYIENNNIPFAYQELNEIVSKMDGSLFYYKAEIELGILELARANYENSLFLFRDVSKNREDDIAAQAQYYIGKTFFDQDRLPEAITELIKVRSLYSAYDEWYTKSLILLGDSYVKINDKANAADMYKAVLKRHRKDAIAKEVNEKLNQL